VDADGKLHVIGEVEEEDEVAGGGSPTKGSKSLTMNTSKINTFGGQVLTLEEIERMRKEHAEMTELLKRYKEVGMVPKTGCCSIF
jgi:hypothetical protein